MKLAYEAYSATGSRVADVIDAASPDEAREQLRRRGLYVTSLVEKIATPAQKAKVRRGGRATLKDLAGFSRQLAVLLGTGTPLVQALGAVSRQAPEGRWRATIDSIREQVEEGRQLADALHDHPRAFDGVFRSLVAAGETSGRLREMLERLAAMTRQRVAIRHTLVGALTYPAVLVTVSITVLVVMIGFVMPRFTGLFHTLGAPLPPTTEALVAISAALRTYWPWTLGGLAGGVTALVLWLRTAPGRARRDTFLIRCPTLGRIMRLFIVARMTRLLGVLLDSRLTLLDALTVMRSALGNGHYERLIDRSVDSITRGESLASALRGSPLVTPGFVEAVQTGESTGRLSVVLLSLADAMDEDNAVIVKSLSSLLEPLIMLVVGLIVGFVAFSMFMPLLDLTALTQGGGAS